MGGQRLLILLVWAEAWLKKLKVLKRNILMLRACGPCIHILGRGESTLWEAGRCGVPLGGGVQMGPAMPSLSRLCGCGGPFPFCHPQ